jgi:hypothetical protein
MSILSKDNEIGPMQARSDLIDILSQCPENTEALVTLIQNELKDLQDSTVVSKISNTITEAASQTKVDAKAKDNVLYWLTQTTRKILTLNQAVYVLLYPDSSAALM